MSKSISFLLGAGFSAPMGYPVGNGLAESLLELTINDFTAYNSSLIPKKIRPKEDFGYRDSDDFSLEYLIDSIQLFNQKDNGFDYEQFYDFLCNNISTGQSFINLFKQGQYGINDFNQTIRVIRGIYTKLTNHFLKDGNCLGWYDNLGHSANNFSRYSSFCNALNSLSDESRLNVHSLNHDLVFEGLSKTGWLSADFSDGFSELGSPYYGEIRDNDERTFKVRLEHYNGEYEKPINLYKLHGSKDYLLFSDQKGITGVPENYLKTRYRVGYSELYKEKINNEGNLEYFNCWTNDQPDFLTGTTQKILRYNEPLLYKNLFDYFQANLKVAEKLVIIGYGGLDSEVNRLIQECFDYENRQIVIVDPYPGEGIKNLVDSLGARLIVKSIEEVDIERV